MIFLDISGFQRFWACPIMTNLIPWEQFEEEYARMLLGKQGGARLTI